MKRLRHRAELVETRIDLNSRDYSNKAVRSALLPTLNLFAYYEGAGVGRKSESSQRLLEPEDRVAAGVRLRPGWVP